MHAEPHKEVANHQKSSKSKVLSKYARPDNALRSIGGHVSVALWPLLASPASHLGKPHETWAITT